MKNYYKIIISVFVFLSFIYPLANAGGFDFGNLPVDFAFSSEAMYDYTVYENMVEDNVKNILKQNNIVGANVKCSINAKDNEISIKSVKIYLPDEYNKDEAAQIIFDNIGIKATVVNIGE